MWMRSGDVYFIHVEITHNGIFRSAERRIGLSFLHLRKTMYGLVLENRIAWLHTEKCFHVLDFISLIYLKNYFYFLNKKEKIPRLFFMCRIRISSGGEAMTRIAINFFRKIFQKKFCNLVSRSSEDAFVDTTIILFI